MPEQETIERAREDAREGKSPSTQAGEFVREGMEHIREGKHGARSAKQAIAIGSGALDSISGVLGGKIGAKAGERSLELIGKSLIEGNAGKAAAKKH